MKSREEIMQVLDEARKNAAGNAQFGNPASTAMQSGANAPIIASALGLLLEIALDIREMLRNLKLEGYYEEETSPPVIAVDTGDDPDAVREAARETLLRAQEKKEKEEKDES